MIKKAEIFVPVEIIQNKIYLIQGRKVMFDFDLALLYGVETRILIQAVKRNLRRFPAYFMFQLTRKEYDSLTSQFVMSNKGRGEEPFGFQPPKPEGTLSKRIRASS